MVDARHVVVVYSTSVDRNAAIRVVVGLLHNFVQQLTRFRPTRRVAHSVCGRRVFRVLGLSPVAPPGSCNRRGSEVWVSMGGLEYEVP